VPQGLRFVRATIVLALALPCARAHAQQGFGLSRFEPAPVGEMTLMVDHPWFSKTRWFAAGLSLNYAHNPLVFRTVDADGSTTSATDVVQHQLTGHLDLAGSFLDRVTISATLPVTLLERGTPAGGAAPLDGVAVGDPRVGAAVRLWNQPDANAVSLAIAANLWIPIGAEGKHQGDRTVRFAPKLILSGLGLERLRWAVTAAYQYRAGATIGTVGGANAVGQELQLGAALGYACRELRCHVGPELVFATLLTGGRAFTVNGTTLEALLGFHFSIARLFQVGAGVGFGLMRLAGTPDGRVLLRLAYAPVRKEEPKKEPDRDGDGIPDRVDACPDVPGVPTKDPRTNGCPSDRDGDGVLDVDDQCLVTPMGAHPDPAKRGCPIGDADGDGILDSEDQCPTTPAGAHPHPTKKGCPDVDTDGDGVFDGQDRCPSVPAGVHPDPAQPGCPLADRDDDTVPDVKDACPDEPGAPSTNPKKNGCPGLVLVRQGSLTILSPVHFATGKDKILPDSFPVLQAVAEALIAEPEIKKVSIEGHTDDRGGHDFNMDLSQRRTQSVRTWLIEHGVAPDRLEAHGLGETQPLMPNATEAGRAKNRRVEFRILQ
jgi:outer membrane protein OmpA-like peptidoglycan-associated protein